MSELNPSVLSTDEVISALSSRKVSPEFVRRAKHDPRPPVRAMAARVERRVMEEAARLERLCVLERKLRGEGSLRIAGVDESGRGPIAGPVVAAAVILPADPFIPGIDDCKKLSPERRSELFEAINELAISIGVAVVESSEIDSTDILRATFRAMREAVANLSVRPDVVIVDGRDRPGCGVREIPVVKGDSKSLSVAAASIIAKVTRDRIMEDYDARFPVYGFSKHKGYGTAEHISALRKHGPCPIHRRSFRTVREVLGEEGR